MTVSTSPDTGAKIAANSLLRTLLLCDLVDSTALVERLGDREAAELIRKHDRLARTLVDRHGGQEIDKTDGFMMMFERPVQAVAFALDYQRGLRQLNAAEKSTLAARVGIHVGDVVVWDNSVEDIAKGAKPVEVEGLVKPVTSRLMNLALPGQILLSNIAYDLAHRAQGELVDLLPSVRWRTHGRYRFRGVPDPVAVFEIGEEGLAPLKAPPWSSKAHREVPFWRRPATVVIEALVVVALIAVPLVMFLRPDPAIAFANRDWVVVGSLHNLTGETIFDDALESALRIGLEQSRYVNVLPDLKVRDTITRMQRDPDTTEVDRAVGSEVAIRDGARALILPTIAEIGGRVRITAEVIDPQTQTTVYSETADGIGKESILPSLDTINERLRVRLGEALATVSNESRPLEKVATKDLDALKAYSLGNQNYSRGQFPEALELYKQALLIDPEFSAAHVRIAHIHTSAGKNTDSRGEFVKALAYPDRLSTRDKLYAEAYLSTLDRDEDTFSTWSALTETYPDFSTATGNFAYLGWREANRFDKKIVGLAEAASSPMNPHPVPAKHVLGVLLLGNERFKDAITAFSDAEAQGLKLTQYHSATLASERKFAEATTLLAKTPVFPPTQNPELARIRSIFEAGFLLDQGDINRTLEILDSAIKDPANPSRLIIELEDARMTINAFDGEPFKAARLKAIRDALDSLDIERSKSSSADSGRHALRTSLLAYFAAHLGDVELAQRTLASIASVRKPGYSLEFKLFVTAEAEVMRLRGDARKAVSMLAGLVDGSELLLTHVALVDAYFDAGMSDKALAQTRWVAEHRGRAYAESNGNLLTLYNIEQTNLALLRSAELLLHLKRDSAALERLDEFKAAWPEWERAQGLAPRIRAFETLQAPIRR